MVVPQWRSCNRLFPEMAQAAQYLTVTTISITYLLVLLYYFADKKYDLL
jgi:hypothetical protein